MPWSEHTIRCFWSVPEMRHGGCSQTVGLSSLCLGRTVMLSIVGFQVGRRKGMPLTTILIKKITRKQEKMAEEAVLALEPVFGATEAEMMQAQIP